MVRTAQRFRMALLKAKATLDASLIRIQKGGGPNTDQRKPSFHPGHAVFARKVPDNPSIFHTDKRGTFLEPSALVRGRALGKIEDPERDFSFDLQEQIFQLGIALASGSIPRGSNVHQDRARVPQDLVPPIITGERPKLFHNLISFPAKEPALCSRPRTPIRKSD